MRFGDPECQVLVPRLASDLFVHCRESAAGELETPVELVRRRRASAWCSRPRATRPRRTARATSSTGLDAAGALDGVMVFHSGTATDDQGRVVTNGGRVLDRHRGRRRRRRGARPRVRGRGRDLVARRPLPSRHRQPRPSRDPPLLAPRDRRAVHRRGALRRVARGRGARGRGVGASSASFPRRRARAVRERAGFDVAAIHEREKITDHDVAAFVDVVQEQRRASPRARGCTTASRRATSSTPRSRCR